MLSSTLRTVALGAVAANALMIPPGVTVAENELSDILGLETVTQSIKLDCPECMLNFDLTTDSADDETNSLWRGDRANSLFLNFTIAQDKRSLEINGLVLFPPSNTIAKAVVEQVPSDASLVQIAQHELHDFVTVTADSVFIAEELLTPAGDATIHLTYQVIDIDDQPITVSGARVNLLKNAGGDLELIAVEEVTRLTQDIDIIPPTHPGGATVIDCHGLPLFVCKIKAALASKVQAIKETCHGMMGRLPFGTAPAVSDSTPEAESDIDVDDNDTSIPSIDIDIVADHKFRHGPHAHHFGGLPYSGQFGNMHSIIRSALMILIPIMAGFTIGMTVSVIGMLIGRLASFLWARYVRNEQQSIYVIVAHDDDDDDERDELLSVKGDMLDEEYGEPLPLYEDSPAYEEMDDKKV